MTRRLQWNCKVCGAPRYWGCDKAFCEQHYLEYERRMAKATYARRKAGTLNPHLGRPPKRMEEEARS